MLAKIQEQIQDRHKGKLLSASSSKSVFSSSTKSEPKQTSGGSTLSKERQLRDYYRANNLCFYCKEPYDPSHASKCTKRPRHPTTQLNTLALNDLDVQLTDDILHQLDMKDSLTKELCSLS